MKMRSFTSLALGLVAAFAVGCASSGSNSAVVSVEDVSGEQSTTLTSNSDSRQAPRVESDANISNTPVPRGYDGQPLDRLSPQEKLRRSRQ